MKLDFSGVVVVDITTYLPPDTLSGAVYLGSFFSVNHIPPYCTSFAKEQVAVMASPEATQEALRTAIVQFSDGIFDLYPDCVPYSPVDARARQLKRWDTQSAWLGYGVHQSTLDRGCVVGRSQDSTRLFELGKEGFPILILHGTQDALVRPEPIVKDAKEHFKNAKIALIEGGTHAVFDDSPTEVMKHIGAFAEEVQHYVCDVFRFRVYGANCMRFHRSLLELHLVFHVSYNSTILASFKELCSL